MKSSSLVLIPAILLLNHAHAAELNSTYVLPYAVSQPDTAQPVSISGFLDLTADTPTGVARYGDYSLTLVSLVPGTPIYGSSYSVNFNNGNSSFHQTHAAADRWYLTLPDPGHPTDPMVLDLNLAGLVDWSSPPAPGDSTLLPLNELLPSYGFRYDFNSSNIHSDVDQIPAVLGVPEPQGWALMLLGLPLIGLLGRLGGTVRARREAGEPA